MESEGEIISVDETVWSLRLGARDPPSNVARFEEIWVGKGNSKRKVINSYNRIFAFKILSVVVDVCDVSGARCSTALAICSYSAWTARCSDIAFRMVDSSCQC